MIEPTPRVGFVARTTVNPRARVILAVLCIAALYTWVTVLMAHRLSGPVASYAPSFVWPADKQNSDWLAFYLAAAALASGEDPIAASQGTYVYPPLLATCLIPLTHWDSIEAGWIWYGVSHVGFALALLLAASTIMSRLRIPRTPANVLPIIALTLLWSIDQTRWEFEQGQSDWIVLLGFMLGLACMHRLPWACGLVLGMAANIKYVALAALPYLAVRRRMQASVWTAVGCIAFALAPALAIGWDANTRVLGSSLERLVGMGRLPDASEHHAERTGVYPIYWRRSQSIPSMAARMSRDAGWGATGIITISAAVAAAYGILVLALARREGVCLLRGRASADSREDSDVFRRSVGLLEWCGVILASLMFSPQMTVRHTFMFAPILMLAAAMALHPRRPVGVWWPMLVGWLPTVFMLVGAGLGDRAGYLSIRGWGWLLAYASLIPMAIRYFRAVDVEAAGNSALAMPPAR